MTGTSSPTQTVTIQNFNIFNGFSVVGPNSADFGVGDTQPGLPSGFCGPGATQSCWVQVSARPSATGVRTASIAFEYDNSTLYVPLSVTGVAPPSSTLSNSFIDFPPTVTGASTTPVPVTLDNSGPGTLTVSGVTISGAADNNFTQTNNCSSVAVNASCTIYVTFAPTTTGVQSATLQITSNAPGSNAVALSGNGLALGVPPSLWPTSLTYNIWGANVDLTLVNSGTTPMSVSTPQAGTTGGEGDQHHYAISSNNCGATLASGSSCTFAVQNLLNLPLSSYTEFPGGVTGDAFVGSLTADILTNSGSVLLQNNAVSGIVTFPANQVGYAQTAGIELASIGSQIVNGQPVATIGGSPAASLAVGGANPGDFTVSAVTSSVTSNPSAFCPGGTSPCNLTITFTPTAAGTRTAKIFSTPTAPPPVSTSMSAARPSVPVRTSPSIHPPSRWPAITPSLPIQIPPGPHS